MKVWLKWLIVGICILGIVGATIGIVYLVKNNKDKGEELSNVIVKQSQIEYFEDTQSKTQPAVLSAWAVGEKQFTKITYQIDTKDEVTIKDATYDVATERWDEYDNDFEGLNYIDTGVITIDLSELEAGKHILQIFVYAGSDARECICEKIFTIQ